MDAVVKRVDVVPDHSLLDHYRTKDPLVRALASAHNLARKAMIASVGVLQGYLTDRTNLTPLDIQALTRSLEDQADEAAELISDEEMLRQIPVVLVAMANNCVQRKKDAESRERQSKITPPSPKAILRARQRRRVELFGKETVTASLGAVLVGPPELVTRAMRVVSRTIREDLSRRIVHLSDTPGADTMVKSPYAVTVLAPWWDTLYANPDLFRKLLTSARDAMSGDGPIDVLLVDDLAHCPKNWNVLVRGTPKGYVLRAEWAFKRLIPMTRSQGASIIAGLKLREGEAYKQSDMMSLSEKCLKYDLSEEDGLLYATDGYGVQHLLAEPGEQCEAKTFSSASGA